MSNPNPTKRAGPNKKFSFYYEAGQWIRDLSTLDIKNIIDELRVDDIITIKRTK